MSSWPEYDRNRENHERSPLPPGWPTANSRITHRLVTAWTGRCPRPATQAGEHEQNVWHSGRAVGRSRAGRPIRSICALLPRAAPQGTDAPLGSRRDPGRLPRRRRDCPGRLRRLEPGRGRLPEYRGFRVQPGRGDGAELRDQYGEQQHPLGRVAAAGQGGAGPAARGCAGRGRLRALSGVDCQFPYHNKTGFHTLAFARGTIESVNSADVVVKAADGTTWTCLIVGDTGVRQNVAKTTTKALAVGQPVFAGGPVLSGSKDARLIVIRPASAGSGSPSPSASGSSSVAGAPGTSVS